MHAYARTLPLIALLAAAALPAPAAAASDDASSTLLLTAQVTSFCQVVQGSGEVELSNGSASFGVMEVCNSAGGYRVLASFANLDSGTVVTADGSAELADDGTVTFVRPSARKFVQSWALRDAVKHDPAAPVFVQVNVSPL